MNRYSLFPLQKRQMGIMLSQISDNSIVCSTARSGLEHARKISKIRITGPLLGESTGKFRDVKRSKRMKCCVFFNHFNERHGTKCSFCPFNCATKSRRNFRDFFLCVCQSHTLVFHRRKSVHYNDVIRSPMASQITSLTIVYSAIQTKHQSSASMAFVRGIHRWPVNSPRKWPVTRKMFPFDDVIMYSLDCRSPNILHDWWIYQNSYNMMTLRHL